MFFRAYAVITTILYIIFSYMALLWVPSDAMQGNAQRIFYFHVPTAWVSGTGFLLAFIYSIHYLLKRDLRSDRNAAVFTTVGWMFTTTVLITGPLWAKPIWGVYWNWSDKRLITYFVLWIFYAAYLLVRMGVPDSLKRARISAVLAILAFINVPLVFFAIRLWNTASHPAAVLAGDKGSGLADPRMKITFWFGVFVFHLIFFLLAYLFKKTLVIEADQRVAEPNQMAYAGASGHASYTSSAKVNKKSKVKSSKIKSAPVKKKSRKK